MNHLKKRLWSVTLYVLLRPLQQNRGKKLSKFRVIPKHVIPKKWANRCFPHHRRDGLGMGKS